MQLRAVISIRREKQVVCALQTLNALEVIEIQFAIE
jgi:hypothetical protein